MELKYDLSEMKRLKEIGHNYKEISQIMGCSYYTVTYHLNPERKAKQRSWFKNNYHNKHLLNKMTAFKKYGNSIDFSLDDLLKHIGDNPRCYFTNQSIDLSISSSYSLDHKIPKSRGGSSNLDNLVLTTSTVNKAKHNLLPDEFIKLCHSVVQN